MVVTKISQRYEKLMGEEPLESTVGIEPYGPTMVGA